MAGFKNDLVQQFCSSRGIKHILSPVGDHRGSGLVERMIQTKKRKLGTAKLDPHFKNFKEILHRIIEDISKSNHSILKKSPFELHFGRKPNTEWSQAFHNIVNSDTSAQRLERNLLTPNQIASQDYSRDRAKVVPRGSASPPIAPRFKPMFSLEGNVAESEPYKALADLARACLKPNFRNNISATQSTLGDCLQAPGLTSHSVGKRPVTRSSQPTLLKKRPDDPSVSKPMVVDLTADSSSEGSSGPNTQQLVRESTPVEKRPRLQDDLPPVTFADSTFTPQQSTMDTVVSSPSITQPVNPTVVNTRTEFLSPADISFEGFVQPAQHVPSEPHSSYPSLSLPAQPVVDDSEAVRTSSRSKKTTKFFRDPLRHSVKIVEEDTLLGEEVSDLPSQSVLPSSHSPRRPLIRDRTQQVPPEASFSSLVNKTQDED